MTLGFRLFLAGVFTVAAAAVGTSAHAQVATNFYGQAILTSDGSGPKPQQPGEPVRPEGSASFEAAESGGSHVTLEVTGLQPGSVHAAQVRAGDCSGNVSYALTQLVADKSGTAHSVTDLADRVHTLENYVTVSAADDPHGPAMLCGQIHVIMTAGGGTASGGGNAPGLPASGRRGSDPLLRGLVAGMALLLAGMLVDAIRRRLPGSSGT